MGEVLSEGVDGGARALARVAEPFHALTYYAQELADFTDEGYKGWWHAYFGYRPAPMGAVGAGTVTSTFYNFAPRMVARAVPGVWSIKSPEEATAMRSRRVAAALARIYGDEYTTPMAEAAALARRAIDGVDGGARPLYGGYAELPWPTDDAMGLWHACTLIREHRGDSHNVALAEADVDGVACQVLMAGRGHGNRPTILAIRGWTPEEWEAAVEGLVARGWALPDGTLTEEGVAARSEIERRTDVLASATVTRLGPDDLERLVSLLGVLVDQANATGDVSGGWPPTHLMKPDDQ